MHMILLQLQKDARKSMNDERKEAEAELKAKKEQQERRIQGKGKGRGRGRGKGRGRKTTEAPTEDLDEVEPGRETDQAACEVTAPDLQRLRSKRDKEARAYRGTRA